MGTIYNIQLFQARDLDSRHRQYTAAVLPGSGNTLPRIAVVYGNR